MLTGARHFTQSWATWIHSTHSYPVSIFFSEHKDILSLPTISDKFGNTAVSKSVFRKTQDIFVQFSGSRPYWRTPPLPIISESVNSQADDPHYD
jgi:hypothetical protein